MNYLTPLLFVKVPIPRKLSKAFIKILDSNETKEVISISDRTVFFSSSIYLMKNIESFKVSLYRRKPNGMYITTIFILATALIWSTASNIVWFSLLNALALYFLIIDCVNRKPHFGLVLTTCSGDYKLFSTTDKDGLSQAIHAVRDLLERQSNDMLEVTIERSKVTVVSTASQVPDREIRGNIVGGDMNIFIQAEKSLLQNHDK